MGERGWLRDQLARRFEMRRNVHSFAPWLSPVLAVVACLVAGQPALAGGKMSVLEGLVRTAIEEGRGELRAGTKLAEDARLLRGGEELFENATRQHEMLLRN